MALFRSDFSDLPGGEVVGMGVVLRHPQLEDYDDWARLRAQSRDFLTPWEPSWARDELTRSAFKRRLRRYGEDRLSGCGFSFLVFKADTERMVGGCNLSNVRRGVAQAASLGYWVGQPYQRQGLISAAVEAACTFAYTELRLHRVEAACIPENAPSRGLLERVNFTEEGMARSYLKINGQWRDHVTYARINPDPA
ncbi:MAG: 30S ribosomal protein S5 alanine N-acetyltransferase [Robiginitomaculum sp.]|nr:MAG: 30S ribosomal protein S5 alanine N-acetyltransferase [Robiginitomaculum sp.]